MNIYSEAPDVEYTVGGEPKLPPALEILFNCGRVVALRASEMALDTWDEGDPDGAASIALRCRSVSSGREMALFIEQSAQDLRAFAASCMRVADRLDGGLGKQ